MKTLLNNRFYPVTRSWGFVKLPFDDVVRFYDQWHGERKVEGRGWQFFESPLAEALQRLEPFTPTPTLVATTKSQWTALFTGSPSGGSHASYISERNHCWGLEIACVENTYSSQNEWGIPGSVQFILYAPDRAVPSEVERFISATHQCEAGWDWTIHGKQQPFENPEYYQARKVRDRFTDEKLEEYCAALGIDLFNENFYGPRFGILRDMRPLPPGTPQETYASLQQRFQ